MRASTAKRSMSILCHRVRGISVMLGRCIGVLPMMYTELWVKRVGKCVGMALAVPTRRGLGGVMSPRRDMP